VISEGEVLKRPWLDTSCHSIQEEDEEEDDNDGDDDDDDDELGKLQCCNILMERNYNVITNTLQTSS
jgi:hypothetical protein